MVQQAYQDRMPMLGNIYAPSLDLPLTICVPQLAKLM